jgi:hypothetical protein
LELLLNTFRIIALPALTSTTSKVSQVTALPTSVFRLSIALDNARKNFMSPTQGDVGSLRPGGLVARATDA